MAFITPLLPLPFRAPACFPPSPSSPVRPRISLTASTPSSSSNASSGDPSPPASDPLETLRGTLKSLSNSTFDTLFTPLHSSCSILQRRWVPKSTSYILTPPTAPKAVIHFLGGAFFSSAPHIFYSTFLETLCDHGFIVVATRYDIGFDYLEIAADIADGWERIEQDLAVQYGELPVIGMGHSAGGVFQMLLSCLFTDAVPRVGNVLLAYSNREAEKAIPGFGGVRWASEGMVGGGVWGRMKEEIGGIVNEMDSFVEGNEFVPGRLRKELWPSLREGGRIFEAFGRVIEEVGEGEKQEFYPEPEEISKVVERLYEGGGCLVVKFVGDELDDSGGVIEGLKNRDGGEVSVVEIGGGHLTVLGQELPDLMGNVGFFGGGVQEVVNAGLLRELMAVEGVVSEWVEKGIENGEF